MNDFRGRIFWRTREFQLKKALTHAASKCLETNVTASQSGFNRAVGYYKAAWEGVDYKFYNHNSNYAANTVIYGAGANVPGGLGLTDLEGVEPFRP